MASCCLPALSRTSARRSRMRGSHRLSPKWASSTSMALRRLPESGMETARTAAASGLLARSM